MQRFRLGPTELTSEPFVPTTLAAGDVLVEVAGVALGPVPERAISGRVVDAGEAATHWKGRRVVVPALLPCGDCDACRRGRAAGCAARAERHGLATHEVVPARFLLSLETPLWPPEWTDEQLWQAAYLADEASAVFGALMRLGLEPNGSLLVVGHGARARTAAAIGRAKGVEPATGGFASRVIETSGTSAGRALALSWAGAGGAVAFLDGEDGPPVAEAPPPTGWERFVADESLVFGAATCHPDLFPELAALVVRGQLDLSSLVAAVDVAGAVAARADYAAGRRSTLPILRFS